MTSAVQNGPLLLVQAGLYLAHDLKESLLALKDLRLCVLQPT